MRRPAQYGIGKSRIGGAGRGGRSTRTTSAPRSASTIAACGAGPIPASSTTRSPTSGPAPTSHPPALHASPHPTVPRTSEPYCCSPARWTALWLRCSGGRRGSGDSGRLGLRVGFVERAPRGDQPVEPARPGRGAGCTAGAGTVRTRRRARTADPQREARPPGERPRRAGWTPAPRDRSTGSPPDGRDGTQPGKVLPSRPSRWSRAAASSARRARTTGSRSSMRRVASSCSSTGPPRSVAARSASIRRHRRAVRIQPIRNPPHSTLAADPTVTTSAESGAPCAATGSGLGPVRVSSARVSSISSGVPVRRASATSRSRPALSSSAPVGFWWSGTR